MAPLKALLERWFAGDPVHVECRACGLSLDSGVENCPNCRSNEIGRYELA